MSDCKLYKFLVPADGVWNLRDGRIYDGNGKCLGTVDEFNKPRRKQPQ